jgi:non-ribosomal peptide synthetase component F
MNTFSGDLPLLNLPVDFPRPVIKDYTGNTVHFYIEENKLNALKLIAQGEGVSMFMMILSVYTILLGKLAGQDDVIVGTNTTGRYHPDTQDILGMFVNTLALRNRPADDLIFRDFLHEVKSGTLAAFEHQAYQYEALIDDLKIERDLSRNPLFDAMFVFQNLDDPQIEMQGVKLTPHEFHAAVSKFDLSLIVFDMKDKLKLTFEYAASLYRQETIKGFISYFSSIVSSIAGDINCKISGL